LAEAARLAFWGGCSRALRILGKEPGKCGFRDGNGKKWKKELKNDDICGLNSVNFKKCVDGGEMRVAVLQRSVRFLEGDLHEEWEKRRKLGKIGLGCGGHEHTNV
jgi:hypothetical protein